MKSRLQQLQERRAALVREGDAIFAKAEAENRLTTEAERTRDGEIEAELTAIKADLALEERRLAREREEPASTAIVQPAAAAEKPKDQGWKSLGEFLLAVRAAGLPNGRVDPRLRYEAAVSGANEGVPSDGGFLVQTDMSTTLFSLAHETGMLSRLARRIPISNDSGGVTINAVDESSRATGSRWGGIRAYWTGEGADLAGSRPKFRKIELKLNKLTGLFYATDELLKDASALEAVATQGFAEEFGFQIDDAIVRGDGSGKPLGILNSGALVTVDAESGQAADTFLYENAIKMMARCWARSYITSQWYINQAIWPQLLQMNLAVGTGGVPVFIPPGGASAAPFGSLLGRPIVPIEQCSAPGDVGDVLLADLSQYILAEKGGIETAMSIHVRFLDDESTFRWILRIDGQPFWKSALTPFKGTANTLSPFVALAAR